MRLLALTLIITLSTKSFGAVVSTGYLSTNGVIDTNTSITIGMTFTPINPTTLLGIGILDIDEDGLDEAHDVAIFRTSDQSLISSATVPSGTTGNLQDGFRFIGIPPTTLDVGVSYTIAAYFTGAGDKLFDTTITSDSSTPFDSGSYFSTGSSLQYPTNVDIDNRSAVNILQIPEPSSTLFLFIGSITTICKRQRRGK